MNRPATQARPLARSELRSRALGLASVVWVLALASLGSVGCGVNRAESERLPGPASLPNLRRASEAQLERIAIESAHVEVLDGQLAALRAKEDRLYGDVIAAEQSYQRLQGDYDGVKADVDAVSGELAAVRGELASTQAELEQARTVLAVVQGDLERARAEALAASAELAALQEAAAVSGEGEAQPANASTADPAMDATAVPAVDAEEGVPDGQASAADGGAPPPPDGHDEGEVGDGDGPSAEATSEDIPPEQADGGASSGLETAPLLSARVAPPRTQHPGAGAGGPERATGPPGRDRPRQAVVERSVERASP